MRLVVDTNVFISDALKANSLPFLVIRWIERHDGLLKSVATENELLEVLQRPQIAALMIPGFSRGRGTDDGRGRAGPDHRVDRRVPRSEGQQIPGAGGQRWS